MPLPTVVASESDQLLAATVALLRGEVDVARHLIDRIDRDALWLYYDAAAFVYEARHDGAAHADRTPGKKVAIPTAVKRGVAARDGWRCRYCGLRLVSRDLIVGINARLGDAFVIDGSVERSMHPAAYLLRYTQDHMVPRSAGGTNEPNNVVAACGTCQFQKGDCTLDELGLGEPIRPPAHGGRLGRPGRSLRQDRILTTELLVEGEPTYRPSKDQVLSRVSESE
jgi:hypothetical protein